MYLETVEYWDDLYPESYKIVIPNYKLELVEAKKVDKFTTSLTIKAKIPEHLKRFLDDLEEGDLDPLDLISREHIYDEDYIKALKKEVKKKI